MYRFDKTCRLLTKQDFDVVFKSAKRFRNPEFTVLVCQNKKKHPRLGLVLSKKIVHKAHDRNRIKRLIRESFRLNKQLLPAVDIVVLARPALNQAEPHQIRVNLSQLWNALSMQYAP